MGLFQRGTFQRYTFQLAPGQVVEETVTGGGWWPFHVAYEQQARKRLKEEEERRERQEEAEQIQDKLDREIAILLRKQEAQDERKAYLERLGQLAKDTYDLEAARQYSDRVAVAYERAVKNGNYSALEALSRELERADEEEQMLLLAMMMLENDE